MISEKRKCIFLLLPKTGTSSIVRVINTDDRYKTDEWQLINYQGRRHYDTIHPNYNNFYKVAGKRNPYDRVVSLWRYWNLQFEQRELKTYNFHEFVKNISKVSHTVTCTMGWENRIHFATCVDSVLISTNGDLTHDQIDYWVALESLQKDFDYVCDKIGSSKIQLPHRNRTNHKQPHYTEYYDEETKQIVAEKYARDIEYFGYEFS